jgi:hypothetical protein
MDSLEAMPNKINSLLKQQEEYKDSKEMLDAVNAIRNKKALGGVLLNKVIKAVKSSVKGEKAYLGEAGQIKADIEEFEKILLKPKGDAVSFKKEELNKIRKEINADDAYHNFLSEFVAVREQDNEIIRKAEELGYGKDKTKNILQGKKSDIEKLNKAYDDLEEKRIGDAETAAFRDKFAEGGEISDEDSFRMMYNSYKQEMEAAESPEQQERIQQNFQQQTQNVDQEVKMNVFKEQDRTMKAEGGSLLVPPEMGMEEEMPVDTFTPEEQAMAEESQVPDDQMEDDYMGFMLDESLDETEQEYLMGALESDPRLSEIFDKVIMTASEFSGAGEVEGPGNGVSDSIPARLSDGEFVITEEATSEIGADNLQTMMDDAERKASGGKVGYAEGRFIK